jgi:plasmid stability protein
MATMSIRGLDNQELARLKNRAEQEGSSLNSLVLRLLQGSMHSEPKAMKKYEDLNALAGSWSVEDAQEFARNTAAFAEVDSSLWK